MSEADGIPPNECRTDGQFLIDLKVEFGGGLESLFSNQTSLEIQLAQPHTMGHLVSILSAQVKPQKSLSLFCSREPEWDIKPGILPLVNDEDWELLEPSGMNAVLKQGDNVMFISTLHGG
ncbi:hypothetical protein PTTG_04319 [Puccinia triticina 1-1 BBBD Race 1]|uniref:Ubiquitin-related modifier 1 n=2 Tax=Puccinia triticina TaxID=208348 RepID=A0A0C4EU40_PUCT1|nr:uncharacterized protein PtA15_1A1001 [Puccinia triticina]OAV94151.1 hypothetical protein PTTG_04319 [Puccinia triticina 1-1 BBBD Race 1]WAQ81659.1 hypothetical protein PtA15_1A1001 [Puccinia triticina]WAR52546.1 hypothetical protein PtB15_1B988 [Puccinia triticina]